LRIVWYLTRDICWTNLSIEIVKKKILSMGSL
jgi:hypothetical protein